MKKSFRVEKRNHQSEQQSHISVDREGPTFDASDIAVSTPITVLPDIYVSEQETGKNSTKVNCYFSPRKLSDKR